MPSMKDTKICTDIVAIILTNFLCVSCFVLIRFYIVDQVNRFVCIDEQSDCSFSMSELDRAMDVGN